MDLQSLKIDRGAPATSRPRVQRRRSPWPLRLAGLVVLGVTGWLLWPQLQQFSDRLRLPVVEAHLVTEAAPATAAAARGTAANGYVVAARRAALSSDVPGRIVEMRVREGSVVEKGEIVARLYADEYAAALQRAIADVAVAAADVLRSQASARAAAASAAEAASMVDTAKAQLTEAEANRDWARSELQRTTGLLREGAGSPRDVTRAQSDLAAAEARVAAMQATVWTSERAKDSAAQREAVAVAELQVARAQELAAAASRDQAQTTLDKTNVRAPFAGIVVLKDAEVGEVVSPNSQGGSNARGAVCTMVDFDSLEVQANVPETTLASVQVGAPADVFLDAFPDNRLAGTVDRIWPTADRQKATVEVRVRLAQRDQRLRPEMGVRIVFRQGKEPDGAVEASAPRARVFVPESAVVTIDGSTGAFVLERDVATFTVVAAGERRGGRVAIDSGLQAGQRIVLDPPVSLRSGDRVRLDTP